MSLSMTSGFYLEIGIESAQASSELLSDNRGIEKAFDGSATTYYSSQRTPEFPLAVSEAASAG